MNHRRPRTAVRTSALPSLAALLASGVVVDGCSDPSAAATERSDRLSSHGENAASAFQGSRLADAVREIGIGLGIIDARSGGDIGPAGAAPQVNPVPMQPSGAIAPVQPTPPPQPVAHPAGGPMRIAPAPPPPPPVVHHAPEHLAVPGGLRAVEPSPR
jgi:hypothetical protein